METLALTLTLHHTTPYGTILYDVIPALHSQAKTRKADKTATMTITRMQTLAVRTAPRAPLHAHRSMVWGLLHAHRSTVMLMDAQY